MKTTLIVVIVLIAIGGIAYNKRDVQVYEAPVQAQEVIEQEETTALSAEDQQYAELMKVKEQEARLEAKIKVKKDEIEEKEKAVLTAKDELKSLQAELAGFIQETASKN